MYMQPREGGGGLGGGEGGGGEGGGEGGGGEGGACPGKVSQLHWFKPLSV